MFFPRIGQVIAFALSFYGFATAASLAENAPKMSVVGVTPEATRVLLAEACAGYCGCAFTDQRT